MPDEIDGSVLENVETQDPPVEELQGQPEVTPTEEEQAPAPPQSSVPDEYKDYTAEEWHKLYRDTNAEVGRKKKEAEEYIQENHQLRIQLQSAPPAASNQTAFDVNQPSHLPRQEAQGLENGRISSDDLTKLLETDPGKALILAAEMGSEIGSKRTLNQYASNQKQEATAEKSKRQNWINTEIVTEIRKIKNEDPRMTDFIYQEMLRIDNESNTSSVLERDPSLNDIQIHKHVRELFKQATEGVMSDKEKTLKEMGYGDDFIKQLKTLEKEEAASGAPTPRAGGVTPRPPTEQMSEVERRYSFLPSVREKYGLD